MTRLNLAIGRLPTLVGSLRPLATLKVMPSCVGVSGLEEWETVTIDKPEDAADMGDLDN